jgi:hypothetical protein
MSRAHQASNVKEIYMGKVVIVAYRPRPGKEKELLRLTREHLPILRRQIGRHT